MGHLIFSSQKAFLSISQQGIWVPSQGLLFCVLVFGALLTAGVALSVFTFYEDHYWADKEFREELRSMKSKRHSTTS